MSSSGIMACGTQLWGSFLRAVVVGCRSRVTTSTTYLHWTAAELERLLASKPPSTQGAFWGWHPACSYRQLCTTTTNASRHEHTSTYEYQQALTVIRSAASGYNRVTPDQLNGALQTASQRVPRLIGRDLSSLVHAVSKTLNAVGMSNCAFDVPSFVQLADATATRQLQVMTTNQDWRANHVGKLLHGMQRLGVAPSLQLVDCALSRATDPTQHYTPGNHAFLIKLLAWFHKNHGLKVPHERLDKLVQLLQVQAFWGASPHIRPEVVVEVVRGLAALRYAVTQSFADTLMSAIIAQQQHYPPQQMIETLRHMVLLRDATLHVANIPGKHPIVLSHAFMHEVLDHLGPRLADAHGCDFSSLMWALVIMQFHAKPQFVQDLMSAVHPLLPTYSATHVSWIVRGLHHHRCDPPVDLLADAVQLIHPKITTVPVSNIAHVVWATWKAGEKLPEGLAQDVLAFACEQAASLPTKALFRLVVEVAQVAQSTRGLSAEMVHRLAEAITPRLKEFGGGELCRLLEMLVRTGRPVPPGFVEAVLLELSDKRQWRYIDPSGLSKVLRALAMLQHQVMPEFVPIVANILTPTLGELSGPDIGHILWAAAFLEWQLPDKFLLSSVALLQEKVGTLNLRELSDAVWACATMNLFLKKNPLESWKARRLPNDFHDELQKLSPQKIANIAWGLHHMNYKLPHSTGQLVATLLSPALTTFTKTELERTVGIYLSGDDLKPQTPAFLESWSKAYRLYLRELGPEALSALMVALPRFEGKADPGFVTDLVTSLRPHLPSSATLCINLLYFLVKCSTEYPADLVPLTLQLLPQALENDTRVSEEPLLHFGRLLQACAALEQPPPPTAVDHLVSLTQPHVANAFLYQTIPLLVSAGALQLKLPEEFLAALVSGLDAPATKQFSGSAKRMAELILGLQMAGYTSLSTEFLEQFVEAVRDKRDGLRQEQVGMIVDGLVAYMHIEAVAGLVAQLKCGDTAGDDGGQPSVEPLQSAESAGV